MSRAASGAAGPDRAVAIRVQVLYAPGCPHAGPTGELICAVAREHEIHIVLEEDLVPDPAEGPALGFRGSPTVLVDGVDLEPCLRPRDEEFAGFG